jgi:hypothetical protein
MFYRLLFLLFYALIILISGNVLLCEGTGELPVLMEFSNLHLSESLKLAKDTLSHQCGVYCIKCLKTGAMSKTHFVCFWKKKILQIFFWIGSSADMGTRLVSHILNHSYNLHLQSAIALYGR